MNVDGIVHWAVWTIAKLIVNLDYAPVHFQVGGIKQVLGHKENGYLHFPPFLLIPPLPPFMGFSPKLVQSIVLIGA